VPGGRKCQCLITKLKLLKIEILALHSLTILNLESPHGKNIFYSHKKKKRKKKRKNKAIRLTKILYYKTVVNSFKMIKLFLNELAIL